MEMVFYFGQDAKNLRKHVTGILEVRVPNMLFLYLKSVLHHQLMEYIMATYIGKKPDGEVIFVVKYVKPNKAEATNVNDEVASYKALGGRSVIVERWENNEVARTTVH